MKNIRIFTSKGPTGVTITTDVTTWAELRPLITAQNLSLENMQCTENINKTTLENDLAVLPEVDFILFLRAIKTKAGADYNSMDRKTLVGLLTPEKKEALKAQTGKNWTNCSTPMLKEFFSVNAKPSKKVATAPKKSTTKATTTKKVEVASEEVSLLEQAKNSINIWEELAIANPGMSYEIDNIVEDMKEMLEGLKENQTGSQEESEDDRVMREMHELEAGFRK